MSAERFIQLPNNNVGSFNIYCENVKWRVTESLNHQLYFDKKGYSQIQIFFHYIYIYTYIC